ncbi:hypothetical protein RRG08_023488 [Elysia crispata]|uniref:Uncharacterized protein n=1 Tax=Elysia crispata TaxID=231223 RepID=A0AAE0YY29_9GAST|nr:hypothetical protein RRG08_023488 [Elysia crispata]
MSDPIVLPGFEPEEFPSTDFVRITIPPLPLLYVEVMILGCLLNLPAWRAVGCVTFWNLHWDATPGSPNSSRAGPLSK